MYTSGQPVCCEGKPGSILARIRAELQSFEETQSLKYSGIDADAHGVITGFNAPECWTAGKSSFSHDRGRQASPSACVMDIQPELAQGASDRRGRAMGRWHNETFVFLYLYLM
jgi:hypothetical protein